MLRSERGRARPLIRLLYGAVARAVGIAVAPRGTVYVARTVAAGDAAYGLSDIDLTVVTVDAVTTRRRRDRLPGLVRALAPDLAVYTPFELAAARRETTLSAPGALYLGERHVPDELGLRERPGLGVPAGEWRRLRGTEVRAPAQPGERAVAAWLELQFWWQRALRFAREPGHRHATYLCFKLVAEPVRILLALEHGELVADREHALRRALRAMPDEEPALRRALALRDRLTGPAPWGAALPDFVRLSARVAARIGAGGKGTRVRLIGADPVLLDWRGLVLPGPREDRFEVGGDPAVLRDLADASAGDDYTVLRSGPLAVVGAGGDWTRLLLRGVHSEASAPVLFAQLDGLDEATFPDVPGFRAADVAARAVAEHRACIEERAFTLSDREWLDGRDHGLSPTERRTGRLVAAARAVLFQRSLEEGEPTLAIGRADVLAQLGDPSDHELDEAVAALA